MELSARLMEIDSTSGNEGAVIDWLDNYLTGSDWKTRRIPVSPRRDDLLATSADAPVVTLSTHVDTVPPFIAPRLDGDRLWGRGACDAKGIVAAMILAGEQLRAQRVRVALLFVVGEEVEGAKWPRESRQAGARWSSATHSGGDAHQINDPRLTKEFEDPHADEAHERVKGRSTRPSWLERHCNDTFVQVPSHRMIFVGMPPVAGSTS